MSPMALCLHLQRVKSRLKTDLFSNEAPDARPVSTYNGQSFDCEYRCALEEGTSYGTLSPPTTGRASIASLHQCLNVREHCLVSAYNGQSFDCEHLDDKDALYAELVSPPTTGRASIARTTTISPTRDDECRLRLQRAELRLRASD